MKRAALPLQNTGKNKAIGLDRRANASIRSGLVS